MEGERSGKTDYQKQAIAFSIDKGRTWKKFEGNPVLPNQGIKDFRDPKVFWHAGAGKWIMTLAAHDQVQFWASPNLKNWLPLSSFGKEWGTHAGVWECPDLFQLKVENSNEMKWVLLVSINPGGPNGGSATQYFVGEFDGTSFLPDKSYEVLKNKEQAVWLDYGRDNYAGVTWSDIPQNDGRRIFMGWMSNWDYATNVPTTEWRSAMTLPRKLILKNTSPGYRILAKPVKEIEKLRKDSASFLKKTFIGSFDINGKKILNPAGVEILLDFEKPVSGKSYIELSNTKGERYAIGYNATENYFFSDRTQVGDISFSEKFASAIHTALRFDTANHVRMHLFFDATSMELFADDGKECMTEIYFPVKEFTFIKLFSEEVIKDVKVMMWNMKSTWSNQQDRNH
jgi:fructan beta-fructosidase